MVNKSKLEEIMEKDGWVLMKYTNCGVNYFSWHKDGVQIEHSDITYIDKLREWKTA